MDYISLVITLLIKNRQYRELSLEMPSLLHDPQK